MKKIFVIGAGLSSTYLIEYLLHNSSKYNWKITLGDIDLDLAKSKLVGNFDAKAVLFDVFDDVSRGEQISNHDLIISLLPAKLHYLVADECVKYKKDLVTASYVSDEIQKLDGVFRQNGNIALCECGLDPGIDHMSAAKELDSIKASGYDIISFKSSTGGLVADEYDDNPWNYKFTWNPRNVIFAGKDGAQYLEHGSVKYIPYNKLFTRAEPISIHAENDFEIYPNRDSLKYKYIYGIENVQTMFRGTIRRRDYASSWNLLIELGLTDDNFVLEDSKEMSYYQLVESLLPYNCENTLEERTAEYLKIKVDSPQFKKLEWLGLFSDRKIGLEKATPATALQKLLEDKWQLGEGEKDMIVMQHEFIYEKSAGITEKKLSTLIVKGEDKIHTAMAKTVGLPLGIAAKLILNGTINQKGIVLPVINQIYNPILTELEEFGIIFSEKIIN